MSVIKRLFSVLLVLVSPLSRIKKLMKSLTARRLKWAIVAMGILCVSTTAILYYCFFRSKTMVVGGMLNPPRYTIIEKPLEHMRLDLLDPTGNKQTEDEFFFQDFSRGHILDTPGCQIPLQYVDYRKNITTNKLSNRTTKRKRPSCGNHRAVYLRKMYDLRKKNLIRVSFYKHYLNLTRNSTLDCCYNYLINGSEPTTPCKQVKHGDQFILEHEFVSVTCLKYDKRNVSSVIYKDLYPFVKEINITEPPQEMRDPKLRDPKLRDPKYNILMIGMDSMSPSRLCSNMPMTSKFCRENSWLVYRAYHKIGDNTFPNIMAALSGKNLTTISKSCFQNMDSCNDLMIWSRFKEAGYMTAFGEDSVDLPDTFSGDYRFKNQPTDHYLRPFFINREKYNEDKRLLCTGRLTSTEQLLDYAYDFAHSYRDHSFFGVFWSNSFSHNENSSPHAADHIIVNFLNKLSYNEFMKKTFVIFYSDHGIRFGKYRQSIESYYDDRLPMLLMWTPNYFAAKNIMQTNAANYNQYRLVTPFDLYNTLIHINHISWKESKATESEDCSRCQSIFRPVSPLRNCKDVNIDEKWCSCHDLFPLDINDKAGLDVAMFLLSHINAKSSRVPTKLCWYCEKLSLRKILRVHFYYDKSNTRLFYVIAVSLVPGNLTFEATILKEEDSYHLVGPSSYLSAYDGYGSCVLNHQDRFLCFCEIIKNC